MPCSSDGFEPGPRLIEISRVACLLDELDGLPLDVDGDDWNGKHPAVWGRMLSRDQDDALVATLCLRLQTVDVTKYSLDLQIWWREHQKADRRRLERELEEAERKAEQKLKDEARASALAKLTPYERKLLGLNG